MKPLQEAQFGESDVYQKSDRQGEGLHELADGRVAMHVWNKEIKVQESCEEGASKNNLKWKRHYCSIKMK